MHTRRASHGSAPPLDCGVMALRHLALFSALAACGCVGTMDSAFKVRGSAPTKSNCVMHVLDTSTKDIQETSVSGKFEETVVVGGYFPGPYDVSLVCEGKVLSKLSRIYPSQENWESPVDLGSYAP